MKLLIFLSELYNCPQPLFPQFWIVWIKETKLMMTDNIRKIERQYNQLMQELNYYKHKLKENKKILSELEKEIDSTNGSTLREELERKTHLAGLAINTCNSMKEVTNNMHRITRDLNLLKNKLMMKMERKRKEREDKY